MEKEYEDWSELDGQAEDIENDIDYTDGPNDCLDSLNVLKQTLTEEQIEAIGVLLDNEGGIDMLSGWIFE